MNVFISIASVVVILAVVLPLFYIYIVSKVRQRLEREVVAGVREEINALVREFNNISLSNVSMLENLTIRAREILREVEDKEARLKVKKTGATNTFNKKANSYISYNQELEARKTISIIDSGNLEKEIVISNQEDVIFEMSQLGYSAQDIALKVDRPVGEIDLILSMNSTHESYKDSDE